MQNLSTNDTTYHTTPVSVGMMGQMLPSLSFYPKFIAEVYTSAGKVKKGRYDIAEWQRSSLNVIRALESVGVTFQVEGLEHLKALEGPVIFIANHLSVMETVVLPALIVPYTLVTYVIKQSLLEAPVFKHVIGSKDPIAVTRTNPRHDLKVVLEQGKERLSRNFSIIIFPQTTRAPFNPDQFSTIGIKLAKRAQVKVIPLALLTDAWENGKRFKDFGKIVPQRKAHFAFGTPISVQGKGNEEHQQILEFIQSKLDLWYEERRAGDAGNS